MYLCDENLIALHTEYFVINYFNYLRKWNYQFEIQCEKIIVSLVWKLETIQWSILLNLFIYIVSNS